MFVVMFLFLVFKVLMLCVSVVLNLSVRGRVVGFGGVFLFVAYAREKV